MPDLASLIEAQAVIVAAWQEKVREAAPSSAQEYTRALAVAVDKYATLKMVEREEPRKPPPPPPPMRLDP